MISARLKSLSVFFPIFLGSLSVTGSSSNSGQSLRGIWGIKSEPLPDPIYYESFIPLVFEFQTPQWNKSDVTFNNWYNCITETVPYRLSCPMTFHMNKAILNLHQDFEWLQPSLDSPSTSDNDFYWEKFRRQTDFCSKIRAHFNSGFIPKDRLDFYIGWLTNCSLGHLGVTERNIPSFNYSIRAPFYKMEINFYKTLYTGILAMNSSLEMVASATLSNSRMAIQGTLLSAYYAEKNRWTHAMSECQAGRIPHSILQMDKINSSLTTLAEELGKHGEDLLLSINPGSLSKYYSLPLTDCVHTEDSFAVRILVPIRRAIPLNSPENVNLSLLRISPVPFFYGSQVCQLKLSQDDGNYLHIHQGDVHRLYSAPDCKVGGLCQVNQGQGSFLINSLNPIGRLSKCLTRIYSKNVSSLKDDCKFECIEEKGAVPMVTRMSSDQLLVTGKGTVKLTCTNDPNNVRELNLNGDLVGSLQVSLPCLCSIEVIGSEGTSTVYRPEAPCSSDWHLIKAEEVVPIHFINPSFYSDSFKNSENMEGIPLVSPNAFSTDLADFYTVKPKREGVKIEEPPKEVPLPSIGASSSDTGAIVIIWIVLFIILLIQGYVLWQFKRMGKFGAQNQILSCCGIKNQRESDENELVQ